MDLHHSIVYLCKKECFISFRSGLGVSLCSFPLNKTEIIRLEEGKRQRFVSDF